MLLPTSSIPDTLPLPIGAEEPIRGHLPPSARLLKCEACEDAICAGCSRYIEEGACAVALFHRKGGAFRHSGHMLCPWCADETSNRLRVRISRTMRAELVSALRELAAATEELDRLGGFSSAIDNVGTIAQTVEHYANACAGVILKDGETWTPTSHPTSPEYEASLRKRLEEIGSMCGRGEISEVMQ